VPAYTATLVKKLQSALAEVKTTEEKLRLSFSAHFDLVSIHPFYDGNGRTGRLLMNYVHEFYSLPLARVYLEDKADYFTALQETRKKEKIEVFYSFMFGQYAKSLSAVIQEYQKAIKPGSGDFSLFF
jgi:Fic family protein